MREIELQKKVLKYLRSIPESYTWKISEISYSGMPDIFFLKKGRAFFIELKIPEGVLSKIQIWTFNQIHRNGMPVYVCYNLEEVKSALVNENIIVEKT